MWIDRAHTRSSDLNKHAVREPVAMHAINKTTTKHTMHCRQTCVVPSTNGLFGSSLPEQLTSDSHVQSSAPTATKSEANVMHAAARPCFLECVHMCTPCSSEAVSANLLTMQHLVTNTACCFNTTGTRPNARSSHVRSSLAKRAVKSPKARRSTAQGVFGTTDCLQLQKRSKNAEIYTFSPKKTLSSLCQCPHKPRSWPEVR